MITYLTQPDTHPTKADLEAFKKNNTPDFIHMPLGLIGYTGLNKLEIVYDQEELPFMHLKEIEKKEIEFIVVNPCGLIPDYQVEILDPDLEFLGIQKAEDVFILNIASIHHTPKGQMVTVNLVGPIIINRNTLKAKQIVIGNYNQYSASYLLYEEQK